MTKQVLDQAKEKMNKSIAAFSRELASIRAGRANASLLDRISVEYYGAPTPINQLAGVAVPEARLLVITPYDKSILGEIEKAIMKSDIGITPTNDGSVIRLMIPALTEERRKDLVKQVKKKLKMQKSQYVMFVVMLMMILKNLKKQAKSQKTIYVDTVTIFKN